MSESRTLRRQEQLLALLAQDEEVSVETLAQKLDVSVWTVRRDLRALEGLGAVSRHNGRAGVTEQGAGALGLAREGADGDPLQEGARIDASRTQAKRRIGQAVAARLPHGVHIALTGGSTTLEVARALRAIGFRGHVLTNALDCASELAGVAGLHVVCTGGEVQPRYLTLAGAVTERVLKMHFFDYAVVGVSGFDLRHGFTVNSQVEAATLNLVAEHARTLIVAMDGSKVGRVAFASVFADQEPDLIVCNAPLPAACRDEFAARGITLQQV
jgi:DeoR/GlpR family transcriptional regulator of sugar metabolism